MKQKQVVEPNREAVMSQLAVLDDESFFASTEIALLRARALAGRSPNSLYSRMVQVAEGFYRQMIDSALKNPPVSETDLQGCVQGT